MLVQTKIFDDFIYPLKDVDPLNNTCHVDMIYLRGRCRFGTPFD